MAENENDDTRELDRGGQGSGADPAPSGLARRSSEPLESGRGHTSIADSVVTKVAGLAAGEVAGIYALGGTGARAMGAVTQRVGLGESSAQGVSVEVGEREAAIDLTVVIEYGESIPQVSEEVRQQVVRRVEGITGLSVVEVNISVDDLHLPGDEEQSGERVS